MLGHNKSVTCSLWTYIVLNIFIFYDVSFISNWPTVMCPFTDLEDVGHSQWP